MLCFILFFIVLVSICLYFWLENQNSHHWKKKNVAYVKKKTPFGLTWDFIVSGKPLVEIYKEIFENYSTEPYIGIFMGAKPALLLRDPVNIQAVLCDFSSFYSRGKQVNKSDKLGNNILFTNEYRRWRLTRKKLSPVFSSNKLKNMFHVMQKTAREFVSYIENDINGINSTCNLMHSYTDTLLTSSLFGIKSTDNHHSPFRDVARGAVASNLKENMKFVVGSTLPCISKLLNFTAFGDFEKLFMKTLKDVMISRDETDLKGFDFIDYALGLQKQGTMRDSSTNYEIEPTDEFVAAQAFFFLIAGVDTAASVLHFTLLELANNHEVLTKTHAEIDEIFKKYDKILTLDAVYEMKYLEMVIKETLRKYPPIGVIHRSCTKDTVLPVGGLTVKTGDKMIIPIYAVHNDPNYHPDPEKYDPERFSAENIDKLNKAAYLPFGGGNRACLGMRLGRLQTLVSLAWLLRRYTLKPQSSTSIQLDPSFFLVRMTTPRYELVPRAKTK